MQGYGYSDNWERWRNYYKSRNDVAHEYSLVKARALVTLIPDFIRDIEFFLNKIKEEAENAG